MRLLVLGANGLVGSNIVHTALNRDHHVVGTFHSEKPAFDISLKKYDIRETLDGDLDPSKYDAIINCAAMTDVDGCERNPDRARQINEIAPGEIAEMCGDAGVSFVHFSTDYVFDGKQNDPYEETDETNPIQTYGETKLAGEKCVQEAYSSALICRLSFVYGVHRSSGEVTGFPSWVIEKLRANESIPLFVDQYVTPSRAGQVATTTLELLDESRDGIYHITSRSCVTPRTFGEVIADRIGADIDLINDGRQSDIDRPAQRPRNTCLSIERIEATLGREQPTLTEDLDAIKELLRVH